MSESRRVYTERLRHAVDLPRMMLNIKTNHGGVCLFNKANYTVRRLQMPSFKSFDKLAVNIHGGCLNLIVGVIYRPDTSEVNSTSFDAFAEFIERVAV